MPVHTILWLFVKELGDKMCLKFAKSVKKIHRICSLEKPCGIRNNAINLALGYVLQHIVCHVWWKFQLICITSIELGGQM